MGDRRVLLTGAAGLIGSSVQDQWDINGTTLVPVHRSETDLLAPGMAARLIEKELPAAVIHLAWCGASTAGNREATENAEWLRASLEIKSACETLGAELYLTGSSLEVAASQGDAYTEAKRRLYAASLDDISGRKVTWLRPYYVFDPAQDSLRVVKAARAARGTGEPVRLMTPFAQHDFVHVQDVASAIVAAVRHRLLGVVEIGSGHLHSVSELVERMGAEWTQATERLEETHAAHVADVAPLRSTGWRPLATSAFFSD